MAEEQTHYEHGLNDDEALDAVDALLSAEPEEQDETETPEKVEAEAPEETQEPEKEVEEPEIDYELSIPMPDGREAMTIGEMKDSINDTLRGKAELEQSRMKLIGDEELFNKYVEQSGVEIPQEFKQHVQNQQTQYLEKQHQLMIRMMPELADKSEFESMRKGIVEAAAASNFTEQEIGQITDARVVHLINRLAKLETEKAKASEKVEQIRQKSGPKGVVKRQTAKKSNLDRQVADAIKSGDSEIKGAAIEALLA